MFYHVHDFVMGSIHNYPGVNAAAYGHMILKIKIHKD